MFSRLFALSLILLLIAIAEGLAQEDPQPDSTLLLQPGMDSGLLEQEIDSIHIEGLEENRPMKITFYAAILPGLGQIKNKKYWKLPILYGGAAAMGYFIDYNNKKYQQYRNALLEKRSFPEALWSSPQAININEDNLQRGVDYYRRNRDLLMILMGGLYLLQMVDAHVDAHLMEFDISDELAIRIGPGIQPGIYMTDVPYGMKLSLHFN